MYAFGTGAWTEVEDYPYVEPGAKQISGYEMIYIPEASSFFVIGGEIGGRFDFDLSQVARFEVLGSPQFSSGTWYDVGQLNHARRVSSYSFLPRFNTGLN